MKLAWEESLRREHADRRSRPSQPHRHKAAGPAALLLLAVIVSEARDSNFSTTHRESYDTCDRLLKASPCINLAMQGEAPKARQGTSPLPKAIPYLS